MRLRSRPVTIDPVTIDPVAIDPVAIDAGGDGPRRRRDGRVVRLAALAATASLVLASCGADTQQVVVAPGPPEAAAAPQQVPVEAQPPLAVEQIAAAPEGAGQPPPKPPSPAPTPPEPRSEPAVELSTAWQSEPAAEPVPVLQSEPASDQRAEARPEQPPPPVLRPEQPPPTVPSLPVPSRTGYRGPPVDPNAGTPPPPLPPLPPPPPPPPPPRPQTVQSPETPWWRPITVLISKETVNRTIPVYDAPGGEALSFRDGAVWSYTFRGNRLVVRVVRGSVGDDWALVELPVRPNGSRGWVRTKDFTWSTVRHHVLVDLSDRLVALYDGDELVTSTRAIVGRPNTPTPARRGFIVEKLPNHSRQNASAVLGDWILMLSFFSEALSSFSGGLPRIALHGTHIPGRVGEALSNGCIRIPNDIIEVIARTAPLGTVVNITA